VTAETSEDLDNASGPSALELALKGAREEPVAPESEEPVYEPNIDDDHRTRRFGRVAWSKIVAYGLLPALSLLLTSGAGYLKWIDSSVRDSHVAQLESVQAAKDTASVILSYRADSVERDLSAARSRLTGQFEDAYAQLTHDVVIPGAKQRHVSAVATVPAAASVTATSNHAVVLVFINQTVTMGNDPPTDTASSVRVTLDRVSQRWLVSAFDPI
jgi:Mce-associated membrane protein